MTIRTKLERTALPRQKRLSAMLQDRRPQVDSVGNMLANRTVGRVTHRSVSDRF
jgi:hypothetical protein